MHHGHEVNLYKRHFSLQAKTPVFYCNTIPMPSKCKIICDNTASQHDSQEKKCQKAKGQSTFWFGAGGSIGWAIVDFLIWKFSLSVSLQRLLVVLSLSWGVHCRLAKVVEDSWTPHPTLNSEPWDSDTGTSGQPDGSFLSLQWQRAQKSNSTSVLI